MTNPLNKQVSLGKGSGILVLGASVILGMGFFINSDLSKGKKDSWLLTFSPEKSSQASSLSIEEIIKAQSESASVLIVDTEARIGEASLPPFEVIVNAEADDCIHSKLVTFEIMRELFTTDSTRSSISRVLVTMRGHLRASLGADDAKSITVERWNNSGMSNFFESLGYAGDSENESVPLSMRSWSHMDINCL